MTAGIWMFIVEYWGNLEKCEEQITPLLQPCRSTFIVYLCPYSEYCLSAFYGPGAGRIREQNRIPVLMQLRSQWEQRKANNKQVVSTTEKNTGSQC